MLRRIPLALLALAACAAFPGPASADVKPLGPTAPGGGWGCPGADYKYGNLYALTEPGRVTKITGYMRGNHVGVSQAFRAMIYRDDGVLGAPGTLVATSAEVVVPASAPPEYVDFVLSPPVVLQPGGYWITQQAGGEAGAACLSGTTTADNAFNADAYADGPSDPFNASGPIQANVNQWTLAAIYETDIVAPTLSVSRTRPNANGWNTADVTVSFQCTDSADGSGVASVSAPVTVRTQGAEQSVKGTCTDKAGNTGSATADHINIDKTKPRISYRGNAGRYAVDQPIHITCRASDGLSGVARSSCAGLQRPAYRLGIGAHTISAIATDKAGNTGSGSASFSVTVTTASLCRLTKQFLQGSNRQAASIEDRSADVLTATCRRLISTGGPASRERRAELIALYEEALAPPIRSGLLKPGQAAVLAALADTL
jgi:hypothetical protein